MGRKTLTVAFIIFAGALIGGYLPAGVALPGDAGQKPDSGAGDIQKVAKIDFQDTQPLVVSVVEAGKYRATVFVRNDESSSGIITFSATAEDVKHALCTPSVAIVSKNKIAPKNDIGSVRVEIDKADCDIPFSGYIALVASTEDGSKTVRKYRQLKVLKELPSRLASCLFLSSFALSAACILMSLVWLKLHGTTMFQRMGPPSWNFSDSWGTNIAVGSTLLSSLLGFSALPDQTHYLNRTAYLSLSLIFGVLITVAPTVYTLLRTPVNVATAPGVTAVQNQGYVLFFAAASELTLWGTLGQLATVGLLFRELANGSVITGAVASAFCAIIVVIVGLLLIYGFRTVVQVATQQRTAEKKASLTEGAEGKLLPSWSLL